MKKAEVKYLNRLGRKVASKSKHKKDKTDRWKSVRAKHWWKNNLGKSQVVGSVDVGSGKSIVK